MFWIQVTWWKVTYPNMFNAFSNFHYILAILKHREGNNHSIFRYVSLLTLHGMEIKFYSWKKSHTCKEGGAYLKISAWHLLINLKTLIYWKNCWSGPINHVRILIFTMLHLKKTKKNTWRYHHFAPVYQKSWWYDLQFLTHSVTDWNW